MFEDSDSEHSMRGQSDLLELEELERVRELLANVIEASGRLERVAAGTRVRTRIVVCTGRRAATSCRCRQLLFDLIHQLTQQLRSDLQSYINMYCTVVLYEYSTELNEY